MNTDQMTEEYEQASEATWQFILNYSRSMKAPLAEFAEEVDQLLEQAETDQQFREIGNCERILNSMEERLNTMMDDLMKDV